MTTEYSTDQALNDVEGLMEVLGILQEELSEQINMSEEQNLLMPQDGCDICRLAAHFASNLLIYSDEAITDDKKMIKLLEVIGQTVDDNSFNILFSLLSQEIDDEIRIKIVEAIGNALANTKDYTKKSMLQTDYELLKHVADGWLIRESREVFEAGYAAVAKIKEKIKEFSQLEEIS